MEACLNILEDFVNRAQNDTALAEGLDLMLTVGKANFALNMIIFELVCRQKTNATGFHTTAYKQMTDIKNNFKHTVADDIFIRHDPLQKVDGSENLDGTSHYKLSEMSLKFVRKPPAMGKAGRENALPYNKAAYGSKDKLTSGWSKAYAKLLEDVFKEDKFNQGGVHCLVQAMVGGGAQTRNGLANLNAMSHRDAHLHQICLDLFRADDDASIKAAADYQKRFEMEVVNKHQTAHPKVMQQWAPHGDLDMNKKQVWEKYIDNPEKYHKLRRIKKDVDKDDVFHARFTIRPAPP